MRVWYNCLRLGVTVPCDESFWILSREAFANGTSWQVLGQLLWRSGITTSEGTYTADLGRKLSQRGCRDNAQCRVVVHHHEGGTGRESPD